MENPGEGVGVGVRRIDGGERGCRKGAECKLLHWLKIDVLLRTRETEREFITAGGPEFAFLQTRRSRSL